MFKTFFPSVIFLLLFFTAKSQDLTGTWEGNTMGDYCKIVIVHIGDSLFGYTYDTGMGYCKADFVGSYDSSLNKVKGQNTEFIERTLSHTKSVYTLYYSKQGNTEYLKGRAAPKSVAGKILSFGMAMPIQYTRRSSKVDTIRLIAAALKKIKPAGSMKNIASEKISKNTPPGVTTNDSILILQKIQDSVAAIKESRNSVVIRSITSKADTVKIIVYDDGDIDGDIVTIFDNGKIVVNKLLLSKQPYEITLALQKDEIKHTIELMAENEGSIPPNTAYMLVIAGEDRVEVKASSDKLSNAAIVIQKSN